MKRIILLIIFILSLVGCGNNSNITTREENDLMKDSEEVHITEIDRFDVDWDKLEFNFKLEESVLKEIEPIDSKQAAIDVGTSIIEEIHRNGKLTDYVLLSITHSTEDNIWCFEYSIDQRNASPEELIECGGLYVAIEGNEGKLIKAWIEE